MKRQHKQVIYKAIKDPGFAKEIFSQLPISEFDDETKIIVSTVNNYYKTNNESLAEESLLSKLEIRMDNKGTSDETCEKVYSLVHDVYELDYTDVNEEATDNMIQEFVRTVLSRDAIMDAVSKGSLGDEETVQSLCEKLKKILTIDVAMENGELIDFFEDYDRRKRELSRLEKDKYPTGFYNLDSIADGGLAKGEVAMAIAQSGGGKTTMAVNLTRNYVTSGKNVLYIPMEEKTDRMIVRFEQLFSQRNKQDFMENNGELDEEFYASLQQAYDTLTDEQRDNHWGKLWIRKYRPHELSPNMFSQLVSDMIVRTGKPIDVVVLDYPDLMKNPYTYQGMSEADAGGRLYEDIRATAQEYDFVLWTLSQLNRTGYGQDVKKADAIEGSKRKLNAVELAFTLNQEPEEFSNGFIRLWIDKLRNNSGVAYNKTVYLKVNPRTMTIRDESEEEHYEHLSILDGRAGNADYKNTQEVTNKDVSDSVGNLNHMLGRG